MFLLLHLLSHRIGQVLGSNGPITYLTMSPSSRKIPALLTKNSAQPCQIESCGEIMWIRVRPIDDDDDVRAQYWLRQLTAEPMASSSRQTPGLTFN